ncbi:MAG: DUF2065 domain-containing protein [Desulfuromonadaceae bacterium]|nr:DUF2065 domain-containing protein [Desulfuromonadaceae bacterium]
MELLLTVVGLLLVIEGIPWFLSPRRFKVLLASLAEATEGWLRLAGLVAMLLGLLLVYLARS